MITSEHVPKITQSEISKNTAGCEPISVEKILQFAIQTSSVKRQEAYEKTCNFHGSFFPYLIRSISEAITLNCVNSTIPASNFHVLCHNFWLVYKVLLLKGLSECHFRRCSPHGLVTHTKISSCQVYFLSINFVSSIFICFSDRRP